MTSPWAVEAHGLLDRLVEKARPPTAEDVVRRLMKQMEDSAQRRAVGVRGVEGSAGRPPPPDRPQDPKVRAAVRAIMEEAEAEAANRDPGRRFNRRSLG